MLGCYRAPMRTASRRVDAQHNAERIAGAAMHMFTETGRAEQPRLADVAGRAGVGIATIYRLFGTREELLKAAFEVFLTTKISPLADTARAESDPAHGLRTALAETIETLAAHHTLLQAAWEAGAIRLDAAERYLETLDELLHGAQQAGSIRSDAVLRDLAAILVMTLATVHPGDPDGADRRRYLALLLDGLQPGPPPLPEPVESGLAPQRATP
jgi:AcrR family transcriptional regulator